MKQQILKILNRISVAVLAFAIVVTVFSLSVPQVVVQAWDGVNATAFASGAGTQTNPYIIRTPAQMGYFLSTMADGVTYEGQYIDLAADVDLTGGTWTSSGNFAGTLDGNGYVVTTPCPLLSSIAATGAVKRLICVGTDSMTRSPLVEYNNGLIESCLVRGAVDDDQVEDGTVGMVCDENNSTGIVRNCAGVGSVSATGDDCDVEVGMVGWNYGAIEHCYAALTLSGSAPGRYNYAHKDIICGKSSGTVPVDCYYDSTLYTITTSQAVGFATEEMESEEFLEIMNGSLYMGCVWETDSDNINEGYPIPATCYEGTVFLSHTTEKVSTYNVSTLNAKLSASDAGVVYYTLDGSNPITSSTRKTYTSGSSIAITGNVTVRAVLYRSGQYGAVSTQKLIQLLGEGTEDAPYQIYNKTQLDAVRMDLTACYRLMNNLTFVAADYEKGGVAPGGWNPIGRGESSTSFTGHFDGQGYAIYGLQGNNGGLFECNGSGGVIEGLRIIDSKVYDDSNCGNVANTNNGTILRCYTKSAYTLADLPSPTTSVGKIYAGGIAGSNGGTIQYCRNDGLVYATSTYRYNWLYVGGIAGSGGGVEFCYNTGLVAAKSTTTTEYAYLSGIVYNGSIYNCRNDGDFYTQVALDYDQYVGGITCNYTGYSNNCVVESMVHTNNSTGNNRTTRYTWSYNSGIGSYLLNSAAAQELYPQLDFDTIWMMTANGPVPQGVMDGEGRCISATGYTAPTCLKTGLATYTDSYGTSVPSQTLPAIGHSYSAWSPKEGTDLHSHTCTHTNCGMEETESHAWEQTAKVAPTCTAAGSVTLACPDCSAETTQEGEAALGHSYTKYTSNHDAVWPQSGTETATCDNGCRTKDTRTIADCVDYGTCGTALTWSIRSDGTLTISGTGTMKDYITRYSNSYTLLDPEWDSFSDCITAVVVEQGVTYIGGYAFSGCVNLAQVSLPEGLTAIGESAFSGCDGLTGVSLPQSLITIDSLAFHRTGLTSVVLPENVISIGKMAFGRCYDLAAAELPAGLQSIGVNAFYATDLTEVTLPAGLTSLGGGAFRGCVGLSAIGVAAGNTAFVSVDGVIYNAAKTAVLAYPHRKADSSYTILSGVTVIGAECFADCSQLTGVIIPDGVESIGSAAFYGTGLTTVDLPESLTELGQHAFNYCENLTSVIIPEGVTEIPYMAFDSCYSLASVTLPSTVTVLGDWAFYNGSLTEIDLPDGLVSIGRHALESNDLTRIAIPASVTSVDSYALDIRGLQLIEFLGGPPATMSSYVFSSGVTAVCLYPDDAGWTEENMLNYGGDLLWRRSNIGTGLSWDLEDGVLTVRGTGAMRNFTGHDDTPWYPLRDLITEIVVEEGVTAIGSWAFGGSTGVNGTTTSTTYYNLTKVSLPDSLKTVGSYAFASAIGLTEITIPKGVTSIDHRDTFFDCPNLAAIQVAADSTTYSSVDGMLLSRNGKTLYICPQGKSGVCDIPAGVTTVSAYAFYCCTDLTEIIIPAGVTTIEQKGFYILNKYCEITFKGDAPTTLGSCGGVTSTNVFWYPANNATWTSTKMNQFNTSATWKMLPVASGVCGENLTWSLSGEGVLTISGTGAMTDYTDTNAAPWAAYRDKISSVVIGNGVITIGARAFQNCTFLISVTIPSSVTAIKDWAFGNCNKMTGVTIPASVSEIGSWAFYACSSLTEVTIPEGVTEIAVNGFYDCTKLKSVYLPSTLTAIREWAFGGCEPMTEVFIPASVTVIEDKAFCGCNELVKVTFGGTQKQWDCDVTVGESVFVYKAKYYFALCPGHNFADYQPADEATCQKNATQIAECDFCYETDTREVEDSTVDHSYVNYTSNGDATCQKNGTETSACIYGCGTEHTSEKENSTVDHSYVNYVSNGDATCRQNGTETGTCTYGCGAEDTREVENSMVDHSYVNYVSNGDATCQKNATETGTCTYGCGTEHTREVENSTVDHKYENYSADNNATCQQDATITSPCTYGCGESQTITVSGTKVDHAYENYVSNGDATCQQNGTETSACIYGCGTEDTREAENSTVDHSYVNYVSNGDATCQKNATETGACTYGCGTEHTREVENSTVDHVYENYGADNNATCQQDATITSPCKYGCGESHTITVSGTKVDHAYGDYVSNDDATCQENGTETASCDYGCGEFDTRTVEGSMLKHQYSEYISNDDATCTADGTETAQCDHGCGVSSTRTAEGSMLKHQYTEYTTNNDATCTADGTEIAYCDHGCGESNTRTEAGSMLKHQYSEYVSNDDATCTADGTETASCDYGCGAADTRTKEDSMLDHAFTEYTSNNDATCTANGTETASCDYSCGATDTRTVENSKVNHCFETYVYNNDATSSEDGTETASCKFGCGTTDTRTAEGTATGTTGALAVPVVTVTNRASDGKPVIEWESVEGATGYEVWRCGTKNGEYKLLYTAKADDFDVAHTGAAVGEDYFYKVRAINDDTTGEFSAAKGVWVDLKQPTIKVTNRASDGKPVISWTAVEGATGYAVYRCGTKNGTYVKMYTAKADDFDVVHTGAAVGNDYFYKVVALYGDNAKCNSAYSAAKGVWVDLKRPTIKVVNSVSSGKPVISWGKVDYAVGYKVYCATGSSTGTYKLIYSTTNPDKLSVTHIGAEAGEAYFYKVVAVHKNSKCTSAYSTAKGVYCDLARPTLTVTLNSKGKPYLSWSEVEGADGYYVYRSTDGKAWTRMFIAPADDFDVNHSGAVAGTTYYYKVIAVCNATKKGNSASSIVQSITVK